MSLDTDDFLDRTLENGRYRVQSLLGKGGMGAAYKARDAKLGTDVVLKVPQREALSRPGARQRFEREVRAMIRLSHPHIVKVIDLGEHDGLPFVIMQFLPGGSLDQQMSDRDGRPVALPAEGLWAWLPDVADALDYVHGERHLHRDVKPSNILLDAKGKAFLSDFGMVKAVEDEGANPSVVLTRMGQPLGTPLYMAPEIHQHIPHDGRVDQYALAVTVYQWLCGRPPFEGRSAEVVMALHLMQPPPPPRQWLPGLPAAVEQALLRALAKELAQRFPDCGGFADAVLSAVPAPARARPSAANVNLDDSAALRLSCPSCRKVLRVAAKAAGKKSRCPGCQAVFLVPTNVPPVAVPTTVAAQPPPPNDPSTPTPPPATGTLANARRPLPLPRLVGAAVAVAALLLVLVVGILVSNLTPTQPTRPGQGTSFVAKDGTRPDNGKPGDKGQGAEPKQQENPVRPPLLDCTGETGVSAAAVRQAQQAWARYLGRQVEEEDEIAPGVKMVFVLVPPGKFRMGSPKEETNRSDDETQHEVELTKPFYLGKYEVTQEQYERVTGKSPSNFKGADLPVETVSWEEADAYALELTRKTRDKLLYRLPSEAEWEYSCRGGCSFSNPFGIGDGRSLSSTLANFNGKYPYGGAGEGPNLEKTARVGSYKPNPLGLYDTHGNVWEWCADWYGEYPSGKATDPTDPQGGSDRVRRGGCWYGYAWSCRAANRRRGEPGFRYNDLGFRLARVPSGS